VRETYAVRGDLPRVRRSAPGPDLHGVALARRVVDPANATSATIVMGAPKILDLQRIAGNRAVLQVLARRPMVVQRTVEVDGFLAAAKRRNGSFKRGKSSLGPVADAIERYNGSPSLDLLQAIATAIRAIPKPKLTKYAQSVHGLLGQIAAEEGGIYLNKRKEKIPRGVNDAKSHLESGINCSLVTVAALLGGRASGIVGASGRQDEHFFVEDAKSKGLDVADSDDENFGPLRMQLEGMVDYTRAQLVRAYVEIAHVRWGGKPGAFLEITAAIGEMKNSPPGTQYIVYARTDVGGGHYVYAENDRGDIKFFDFQRDLYYKKAQEITRIGNFTHLGKVRVTDERAEAKPLPPLEAPKIPTYRTERVDPTEGKATTMLFIAFEPRLRISENLAGLAPTKK
jgi:hypothetical protein